MKIHNILGAAPNRLRGAATCSLRPITRFSPSKLGFKKEKIKRKLEMVLIVSFWV
jgi:hypothetical protein